QTALFTITSADANGCAGSQSYSILSFSCNMFVIPTTLPDGQVGVDYNQAITVLGGNAPFTFSISAGSLPAGLTLDSATGVISGIPTAIELATFTLTVTDAKDCVFNQPYTINITGNCDLSVTPTTLPDGVVGIDYNQTITASGGIEPYTFATSAGALPSGLTLDSATGVINGIPTTVELATFTLTVTDAIGCSLNQPYTINIVANCDLSVSPLTLPDGQVGVDYDQTITASGGVEPYTFSITAGALPAGLTLDGATGVISGIPTTVELASFTFTVTDSQGCTLDQPYTINILAAPCLFCDDFEDNILDPNWTIVKQAWNEAGGFLVGSPTGRKATIIASPIFQGCQICFQESSVMTAGGPGNRVWMLGWYIDKKNTMELLIKEENDKIILKQRVNGSIVAKSKGQLNILPNTTYVVRVSFDGALFSVLVDSVTLFTLTPIGTVPTGTIGFQAKRTTGSFGYILVN
ncbi:Ig domain-containing protein, partial [bacterium]|nr:Ig domain-containing protein [bacterium]